MRWRPGNSIAEDRLPNFKAICRAPSHQLVLLFDGAVVTAGAHVFADGFGASLEMDDLDVSPFGSKVLEHKTPVTVISLRLAAQERRGNSE